MRWFLEQWGWVEPGKPLVRPSLRRKLASTGTGGTGLAFVGIGASADGALSTALIVVGGVLAVLGFGGWLYAVLRQSAEPAPEQGRSPAAPLRASLRNMMAIRESMNQQPGSGQWSGSLRDDPLFVVSKEAYEVVRSTDEFTEYADEFWGPELTGLHPGYFLTAYDAEVKNLNTDGRRGYLDRRIALLQRILREQG